MRFHVLKRKIQNLWKKKGIRIIVVLVVAIGTLWIQYFLANRPEPLELRSKENKFAIPSILPEQKLIIEVNPSSGLLISHAGKLTEEVDLHLSNAKLGAATLREYQADDPPTGPGEINCSPTNWHQQPQPDNNSKTFTRTETGRGVGIGKPCSTSINISLIADKENPLALAFFQTDTTGRERYRHLVLSVLNAGTTVKLKMVPHVPMPPVADSTNTANNDDDRIVDCGRYLTVGEWHHKIGGPDEIESVMEANSRLRMRFTPLVNGSLWSGADGFFEPFSFKTLEPPNNNLNAAIKSRTVSIKSQDETKTIFNARSTDEHSPINIDSLRVGSDRIQVDLSGTA